MTRVLDLRQTANVSGPNGSNGIDGLSAYEIAVIDGFSGTQTEWLDSLVAAASEGSKVTINDTNLPYTAANIQEAIEEEQNKIIYGGNY